VRVLNITGTTEGLFQGIQEVEREDWIYFSFHPYAGFEFREIDSGVYEHWAVRNDERVDLFQGLFHTFPDVKEMSLKDLYTKHPTKPGLWRYKGRADDIIVLSNGEKIRMLTEVSLFLTPQVLLLVSSECTLAQFSRYFLIDNY